MLPVPVVSDGVAAAASVRGGFAIITRPVIQNGPWVAAHITRLTRVKTNPLGNELEWELPWLVDAARREGNSRAAGGRKRKKRTARVLFDALPFATLTFRCANLVHRIGTFHILRAFREFSYCHHRNLSDVKSDDDDLELDIFFINVISL